VALALALHINDCILKAENATYITRSADLLQAAVLEVMTSPDHGQLVKEVSSIGLGRYVGEGGSECSTSVLDPRWSQC